MDNTSLPTYEELLKQGYNDKFNTLSLRFIEGPKNDSLKLPLDLRCGTLSFSQDPRIRDVYNSNNAFRFITFNLLTERILWLNQSNKVLKCFFFFKENNNIVFIIFHYDSFIYVDLTNLKLQVHDAYKNCIHQNSLVNNVIEKMSNHRCVFYF
jgi:hypothetical protein